MGSKRDSSEGPGDARSLSVKSTRISEENVEMFSPGGELAALAATTGLTPAASLVRAVAEPPTAAIKRSRAGARSVPPALMEAEDSPSRHGRRAMPDASLSPGQSAFEVKMLLAFDELNTKFGQMAFNSAEEHGRDRARIAHLEKTLDNSHKEQTTYTDRSLHELRGELSQFTNRLDEVMQMTIQSVASLVDLDDRFKLHLSTAFAARHREIVRPR